MPTEFYIETQQLILRELKDSDVAGIFELDSDPLVHRYLGGNTIKKIDEAQAVIDTIKGQYQRYGIGRWATIEKATGDFIGWSGLKYITALQNGYVEFHDIGYRFMPRYWGKGYATGATMAALQYGFGNLWLGEIVGMANTENKASKRVLEKCGLQFVEHFMWRDIVCDWMVITKEQWQKQAKPCAQ